MITAERLREVLSYDPETGEFWWIAQLGMRPRLGSAAGCIKGFGYRIIAIDKIQYGAHRLAWLYVHGVWPAKFLDHIDGNPANNRIANLREATNSQNQANRKSSRRPLPKGVARLKNGRFQASVKVAGKNYYLGTFTTPEEAGVAYAAGARKYFGEFTRAA